MDLLPTQEEPEQIKDLAFIAVKTNRNWQRDLAARKVLRELGIDIIA